jgi:spermidine synthase
MPDDTPAAAKETNAPAGGSSDALVLAAYITSFLTGVVVLVVEIAGTHLINPVFGSSTIVWTAQIIVTLGGLAGGYWLGGLLADRYEEQKKAPPRLLVVAGLVGSGGYLALLPFVQSAVVGAFARTSGLVGTVLAASFLFLIPIALLGAMTPVILKIVARKFGDVATVAGRLFAISTVGSIVGAGLVANVLLPSLSLWTIFWIGGGTLLVMGAAWAFAGRTETTGMVALAICALPSLGFAFASPPVFAVSVDGVTRSVELLYQSESPFGRIQVAEYRVKMQDRNVRLRGLLIDGTLQSLVMVKSLDKLISQTEYTYAMQAVRRFNMNGDRALVLGVAGASIIRNLLDTGFEVDSVEINPQLVGVAQTYFGLPESEGRRIIVDDARRYLNNYNPGTSDEDGTGTYDFVFVDVFNAYNIPPHVASKEAFAQMKRVMTKRQVAADGSVTTEDGIAVVNVTTILGGDSGRVWASIYQTIASEFKYVAAFFLDSRVPTTDPDGPDGNILIFASESPFTEILDERLFLRIGVSRHLGRDYEIFFDSTDKHIHDITRRMLDQKLMACTDGAVRNPAAAASNGKTIAESGMILTDAYSPIPRWQGAATERFRRINIEQFGLPLLLHAMCEERAPTVSGPS